MGATGSTTQVTSTAAELNLLDGSAEKTVVNGKAVIYGSSGEVNVTKLQIASTDVTASAAELNKLSGVTVGTADINKLANIDADIQTQVDGKLATLQHQQLMPELMDHLHFTTVGTLTMVQLLMVSVILI